MDHITCAADCENGFVVPWKGLLLTQIPRSMQDKLRLPEHHNLPLTDENGEIKEAITARLQQYMDAYNQGDVKKVATFYTNDSFFVAPERKFLRGPEGFLRCGIVKQMMDLGGKRLEIQVADMQASGHVASFVAKFLLFNDDGEEIDDGRLVHVWVKTEDQWFLKYDIFN